MKLIITGGAGFVGKNLIRVMMGQGFKPKEITVIDKDTRWISYLRNNYPDMTLIEADMADQGPWMDAFKNAKAVISLQAQIKAKTYEPFKRNCVDATRNVLAATKKHKIKKLLHYGSAAVYSVRKDDYANTKKMSNDLVEQSKIDYVIINPSMMFGPLDGKNVGWLISFSRKVPFFPIAGDGSYPRQPIYIDDIAQLTIKLLKQLVSGKIKNKTFSINGKILTFYYMCNTVVKKLGGLRWVVKIPVPIFKFLVDIYNLVAKDPPFTSDQVDSLVSGDLFDQWAWWVDYDIELTPFDVGVENMLKTGS